MTAFEAREREVPQMSITSTLTQLSTLPPTTILLDTTVCRLFKRLIRCSMLWGSWLMVYINQEAGNKWGYHRSPPWDLPCLRQDCCSKGLRQAGRMGQQEHYEIQQWQMQSCAPREEGPLEAIQAGTHLCRGQICWRGCVGPGGRQLSLIQ